jgi:hypothetical protein
LAHFLSDAFDTLGLDQTDGEAAQAGDVLRAVAGVDAAAVLVIVPIEDVMAPVFDTGARLFAALSVTNICRVIYACHIEEY